jgi:hypothetical protein
MLNEKQNNSSHWKNKLEEPGIFSPEEMMDKTLAWEKLHERLREKPRKKIAIWYWAAAACLLLLFLLQIVFVKKNEEGVAKAILPQHVIQPQVAIQTLPAPETQTSKTANNIKVEKKQTINTIKKADSNLAAENDITTNAHNPVSPVTPPVFDNVSAPPAPLPDTVLLIAAKAPVKKKLQVVHINELGNPVTEMALTAFNQKQTGFGVSLGSSNHIINQSTTTRHDYTGLIKIKIASN